MRRVPLRSLRTQGSESCHELRPQGFIRSRKNPNSFIASREAAAQHRLAPGALDKAWLPETFRPLMPVYGSYLISNFRNSQAYLDT